MWRSIRRRGSHMCHRTPIPGRRECSARPLSPAASEGGAGLEPPTAPRRARPGESRWHGVPAVPPPGVEPGTSPFVAARSVLLSHGGLVSPGVRLFPRSGGFSSPGVRKRESRPGRFPDGRLPAPDLSTGHGGEHGPPDRRRRVFGMSAPRLGVRTSCRPRRGTVKLFPRALSRNRWRAARRVTRIPP